MKTTPTGKTLVRTCEKFLPNLNKKQCEMGVGIWTNEDGRWGCIPLWKPGFEEPNNLRKCTTKYVKCASIEVLPAFPGRAADCLDASGKIIGAVVFPEDSNPVSVKGTDKSRVKNYGRFCPSCTTSGEPIVSLKPIGGRGFEGRNYCLDSDGNVNGIARQLNPAQIACVSTKKPSLPYMPPTKTPELDVRICPAIYIQCPPCTVRLRDIGGCLKECIDANGKVIGHGNGFDQSKVACVSSKMPDLESPLPVQPWLVGAGAGVGAGSFAPGNVGTGSGAAPWYQKPILGIPTWAVAAGGLLGLYFWSKKSKKKGR